MEKQIQTQIFDSITESLYPHQVDALESTFNNNKGLILMPTNSGKTIVASAVIGYDILSKQGFGIYQVNVPKIILSYQIMEELYKHLLEYRIDAQFCFVHSGRSSDATAIEKIREDHNNRMIGMEGIDYRVIHSTLHSDTLADIMRNTQRQNTPLVIISTYHSADRVELAREKAFGDRPLDIIINDEAHYLIEPRHFDLISGSRPTLTSRQYFFTATALTYRADNSRGMNNTDVYGDTLYSLIPRELIDMGMMVRPKKVILSTNKITDEEKFKRSIPKIIRTAFTKQIDLFKKKHPDIAPKMLVATKGKKDILRILNSKDYHKMRDMDIDIFAIHSHKDIGNWINGVQVSRQQFLREIKIAGSNPSKKMIVLHYDILTEGIDVPGLTSLLLLRPMKKAKFVQSYGRIARLSVNDRRRIVSEELLPTDPDFLSKLEKPYGYVIIPSFTYTNDAYKKDIEDLIAELRDYNYNPYEDIIIEENAEGDDDDDDDDGLEKDKPKRKVTDQITIIYNKIESDRIAKLKIRDYFKNNKQKYNKTNNQNK